MKPFLLLCTLLLSFKATHAQDTMYYDANGCPTTTLAEASTKRIILQANKKDSTATIL